MFFLNYKYDCFHETLLKTIICNTVAPKSFYLCLVKFLAIILSFYFWRLILCLVVIQRMVPMIPKLLR